MQGRFHLKPVTDEEAAAIVPRGLESLSALDVSDERGGHHFLT